MSFALCPWPWVAAGVCKIFTKWQITPYIQSFISIYFQVCGVWFQLFCIRSQFFYYDKTWNRKKYPFADLQTFWNLIWTPFDISKISKQQNKSISNGKKIIPRSIFCHFNFCCIRWNHLRASYHLSNLSSKNIKKKKEPLPQIVQV